MHNNSLTQPMYHTPLLERAQLH